MKKLLQIVVIALVAILTAQPAVSGLTCGMMPSTARAQACDMAMSDMGAACPMHHNHTAGTGCLQECCRNGWPQAVVQSASKAKPKSAGARFLLAVVSPAPARGASFATPTPENIVAAGPARHVLLQVFRI